MDAQNLRRLDDAALGQFHQLQQRLDRATDQLRDDEQMIAQLQNRLAKVVDDAARMTAALQAEVERLQELYNTHRRGHAEQMSARVAADRECEKAIDLLRRIAQAAGLIESQLHEQRTYLLTPEPLAITALRPLLRRLIEQVQREYPTPPELVPSAAAEKGGVQ